MRNLLYSLIFFPTIIFAQTATENFVKTTNVKIAGITLISQLSSIQSADKTENVTYYDGLGRPKENVAVSQSATGKDIVTYIPYDALGRQSKEYLPVPTSGNTMAFQNEASVMTLLNSYSPYSGQVAYSEKLYDTSPLNKVLKQSAPGNAWSMGSGHEIRFDYQTNSGTEVKLFKATATLSGLVYNPVMTQNGSIKVAANELYKTVTKSENWSVADTSTKENTIEEFADKEGRVVLKRTYGVSLGVISNHDTYYVYDQFGNLTYVITPSADSIITQTILDDLCYQYKYDYKNRLVEKKLPGKQWEFIVYDKTDKIIATGPCLSPFPGNTTVGWLIKKYDILDREVYTGWYTGYVPTSQNRQTLQNLQDGNSPQTSVQMEIRATVSTLNGVSIAYTNNAFPQSGYEILTINYYDNYTFPNVSAIPTTVETQLVSTTVRGLTTGSWVRALTSATNTTGESVSNFYDSKSRVISVYSHNYLGGYLQIDNKLNFNGDVEYSTTYQKGYPSDTEIKIVENFSYTPEGRLANHNHKIGLTGTAQLLNKITYDELGNVVNKRIGGTDLSGATYLQSVDQSFNIRGWLTEINNVLNLSQSGQTVDDFFAYKINYESPIDESPAAGDETKAQFNGNISETYWKSADFVLRKYAYSYDGIGRLTGAIYQKPGASPFTNSYNESQSYDKNGNIKTLQRNGGLDDSTTWMAIDILNYTYNQNTNRLVEVTDTSADPNGFYDDTAGSNTIDFGYDAYGNMTSDLNKGITITYNHLNLPLEIIFNGNQNTKISYSYNALGQKVKKVVSQLDQWVSGGVAVTTTDYLDGYQYINSKLSFFAHAEGYVKNTISGGNNVFSYVYQYKDHLGNNRLSYGKVGSLIKIIEEDHYYPFGLRHTGYNDEIQTFVFDENGLMMEPMAAAAAAPSGGANVYKYKYNGKEWQDELGLNMYDYGARFYDPAIGRWFTIDQMAEKFNDVSPYNYALNNPILYIDPDGNEVEMCCDGLKAFILTAVDNATGTTNYRNQFDTGSREYHNGKMLGHGTSMGASAVLMLGGGTSIIAGTSGLAVSAGVSTTGIGASVGGPGAVVSGLTVLKGVAEVAIGSIITANTAQNLKDDMSSSGGDAGKRTKNRLLDEGTPNSMETNKPGTTTKKYGPDGKPQKEFNTGHQGPKTPKAERVDHVHDYKPNPNNPSGRGDRMPGRKPKPNEMSKDKYKVSRNGN